MIFALLLGVHALGAAAMPTSSTTGIDINANRDSAISCDVCVDVISKLEPWAENTTDVNATIAALERECAAKFNGSKLELKVCDTVVQAVVDLIPFAFKEVSQLAWDASQLCAVADVCKVNCCESPGVPEQVHLSLTKDPTRMAVMWTTSNDTSTHTVKWGKKSSNWDHLNSSGTSTTYTQFGWVGALHTVEMSNLIPGEVVYYVVGDPTSGFSKEYSFTPFPSNIGSNERPLRIASVGDMGYANLSDNTISRMSELAANGSIDMVVHNGDISYADGDMGHWDVFMRKIEPIASRVPYMTSPGNHEFWFNFTAYKHRFAMPVTDARDAMYYTFRVGDIARFVGMNTESVLDVAEMKPRQVNWIQNELSREGQYKWTIAFGHRPLYCSNTGGNDIPAGNKVLRKAVEETLYKAKVDLVLQAHVHDYERTWPVFNELPTGTNYSNPSAPVYIVNGAAGNREGNDNPPAHMPWEPSGVNYSKTVSFGIMTVTSSALKWDQFASVDGTLQDTFTITKE